MNTHPSPLAFAALILVFACLFSSKSSADEILSEPKQLLALDKDTSLRQLSSSKSTIKIQRLDRNDEGINVHSPSVSQSACTYPLQYLSGPVLPNVKVITIFWGGTTNVPYSSEFNNFYRAVTNSPWMKILSEYSTPAANIGMGSFVATYSYDNAPPYATMWDVGIQYRLTTLIQSGFVPPPDGNTYYAIHFPPSVIIRSGSVDASCSTFCAYHGSFYMGSSWVAYGVMPTCIGMCGRDSIQLNNLYSVASHELAEAVTDPTGSGWASPKCNFTEIGDMCNHIHDFTVGSDGQSYMIQKQWSNRMKSCIGNAAMPSKSPSSFPTLQPTSTMSSCYNLTISLLTDNRGYQTWLYVVDRTLSTGTSDVVVWNTTSQKLVMRTLYTGSSCFDKTHCFLVNMMDRGGDGMCCNRGNGWYEISWNGANQVYFLSFSIFISW